MMMFPWAVAFLAAAEGFQSLVVQPRHDTSLSALPPLIIGPMIRKMREEQAKKNMPMLQEEDKEGEAPGLRVGKSAWKWPPIWPYDKSTFAPVSQIKPPDMANLANLVNPTIQSQVIVDDEAKFDALQYWGVEKARVPTELDPSAAEKLRDHYAFYLKDGMSVLELGAAEESYLPPNLKLLRHVGIGASDTLMKQNRALTESYVVDLNKVEEDQGVDSEIMKQLSQGEPFDAIIMANTIDYLTSPREVFRSCWYLLKPGGTMIVAFSNKQASYGNKFNEAKTRMWNDYNDDQHMWVTGSIFEFSAGGGWENLRGFDISPAGAKNINDQGPLSVLKGGKNNNMYVVQADKAPQRESIDPSDPEASFDSKMWMLPVMEKRDKMLVLPRLTRAYQQLGGADFLGDKVELLSIIYESLIKMDQFTFTFNMQAQLAVDLLSDPDFNANEEQIMALKQGLGLRTPSPEFWAPVGQLTNAMEAEEKINLLAHIVPRFGSGNPDQEAALQAFVSGLKPTFDYIRQVCPSLPESDVQLVGTELLAAEVLHPCRSSRAEFAAWLSSLTDDELLGLVKARKRLKQDALAGLQDYRRQVAEAKRVIEEREEMRKNQLETARRERTMEFNYKTGKFEKAKKN